MERLNTLQLKELLKLHGSKTSGSRNELVIRLTDVMEQKGIDIATFLKDVLEDEKVEVQHSSGAIPKERSMKPLDDENDEIQPNDSASQASSRSSRRSILSNLSEKRADAAAKKAGLAAKLEKMKEAEQMRNSKLQRENELREIEEKLKFVEIEAELAEATAIENSYALFEGAENVEFTDKKSEYNAKLSPPKFQTPFTKQLEIKPEAFSTENRLKPDSSKVNVAQSPSYPPEIKPKDSTFLKEKELDDKFILRTLVDCNLKSLMPKQEVPIFSGDVSAFTIFMDAFETTIASKTSSNKERLRYLQQYTKGVANDIVKSCLYMDDEFGYKEAITLLNKRFGDPYQIGNAYITKLLEWPTMKSDEVKEIDKYAIMLRTCKNAVSKIDYGAAELQNPKTMVKILSKLPFGLQESWREQILKIRSKKFRAANFEDLVSFVEQKAAVYNDPLFGRQAFEDKTDEAKNNRNQKNKVKVNINTTKEVTKFNPNLKCWYCEKEHILDDCDEIKNLEYEAKVEAIKNMNLCFSCLRKGHLSKQCYRRKTCKICQGMHPTILHRSEKTVKIHNDINNNESLQEDSKPNNEQHKCTTAVFTATISNTKTGGVSVVPVNIKVQDKIVKTYAFIDNGSTVSFCTHKLAKDLGISNEMAKVPLTVTTINGDKSMNCGLVAGLCVSDEYNVHDIELPPVFVVEKIPVDKTDVIDRKEIEKWPHLNGIEIPYDVGNVEILIGTNVPAAMEPQEIIKSPVPLGPYASRTRLGWVVHGLLNSALEANIKVNRISIKQNIELDRMINEAFNRDFEDLNEQKKQPSIEDQKWMNIVEKGCSKLDGHYVIPLPLRDKNMKIPNTRPVALRRAFILKKKLMKDDRLRNDYITFMRDMFLKGHAEPVPEKEIETDQPVWFIPHFAVRHPDKPEKVRVVFDCAARVEGVCLNDLLLQGPDINSHLLDVLLRFRCGRKAYMGDIESMYYQVGVPLEYRNYFRFLWWNDDERFSDHPSEFRMTVHVFGACSSPSIAIFALKQGSIDQSDIYSDDVCDTIKCNFYVDDCLQSHDDEQGLRENLHGVIQLCKSSGFNFGKLYSPYESVLQDVPVELMGKGMIELFEERITDLQKKALGVVWNLKKDTLKFPEIKLNVPKTKKDLLSIIASIYDPIGFKAPSILEGRLLMQKTCMKDIDGNVMKWDDHLNENLIQLVENWLLKMKNQEFEIPRCFKIHIEKLSEIELHVFSDASESGHGCVAYARMEDFNGFYEVSFIMGKARVNPLKTGLSIPRLELTAAVLAVKIKEKIINALKFRFTRTLFWSDSMVVLRYIQAEHLRFATFVSNRVGIIRNLSEPSEWRYISSEENPADGASRAKQTEEWLTGPSFLRKDEIEWPKQKENLVQISELEIKKEKLIVASSIQTDPSPTKKLIEYFSSWIRLSRAVAWLMKIKEVKCQPKLLNSNTLSVQDISQAKLSIIRFIQKEEYGDFVADSNKLSSLRSLSPIVVDGIVRVGGRLQWADVNFNEKHPIIIPSKSHVTTLIIRHFHSIMGHMGVNSVLNKIREQFWIVKGYTSVRRIINKCTICKRLKGKQMQQMMANLPEDRLTANEAPFSNVGIDCFGPFFVKRGRTKEKHYGVIFTCLVIRAVHIEVAPDLSTNSFLNAIFRFIARRGKPKKIRCDNGTNFVGAKKQLDQMIDKEAVERRMTDNEIMWIFNPPAASHFGGVWERMIRTTRRIFESLLNNQVLTADSLHTLFCEAELIINSRPITRPSSDVRDENPLTPFKLLCLSEAPVSCGKFDVNDNYCNKRWRQVQYMACQFWCKWKKSYLATLIERQKWLKKNRNLKIGDIVIVSDENTARSHWPLGKIKAIKISDDGMVRSAEIKLQNKYLTRPISKLVMILENEC